MAHNLITDEHALPRCDCGYTPNGQTCEALWRDSIKHVEKTLEMNGIDPVWNLASKWYDIAADESVNDDQRHAYRECANQLEDALADLNLT